MSELRAPEERERCGTEEVHAGRLVVEDITVEPEAVSDRMTERPVDRGVPHERALLPEEPGTPKEDPEAPESGD